METFQTEKLVRERSGNAHNRLDSFSNGGWNLPHDLCPQLKHGQFIVGDLRRGENYRKYEFQKGTLNETRSRIGVLWLGGPGNRQHQ